MLKSELQEENNRLTRDLDNARSGRKSYMEQLSKEEIKTSKLRAIIAQLEIDLATVKGYAARVIQEDNDKVMEDRGPETGKPSPFIGKGRIQSFEEPFFPDSCDHSAVEQIAPYELPRTDRPSGKAERVSNGGYPQSFTEKLIPWTDI